MYRRARLGYQAGPRRATRAAVTKQKMGRSKKSARESGPGGEERLGDVIRWLVMLLVFAVPIFVYPPMVDMYDLAKVTLVRFAALALLILWALWLATCERVQWRRSTADFPLAMWLIVLTLATAFSGNPLLAFIGAFKRHEGLSTFIIYGLIFWVTVQFFSRYSQYVGMRFVLFMSANLISVYAILQRMGMPMTGSWGRGWDWLNFSSQKYELARSFATLGNPVFLAVFVAFVLPLALAAFLQKGSLQAKVFYGTTTLLSGTALTFTYSRGGWAGGLVGLVVLAVLMRRHLRSRLKEIAVLAVIALAAIAFVSWAPIPRAGSAESIVTRALSSFDENTGSSATRLQMWKSTAGLIKDNPLGIGAELFKATYPRYRPIALVRLEGEMSLPDRPHNELLYVASISGVLGLMAYLWFLCVVWWQAGRWLKVRNQESRMAVAGLLAATVSYSTATLFSFSMITATPIFYVFMAMLLLMTSDNADARRVTLEIGGAGKVAMAALVGVAILVGGLGAYFASRIASADSYYNQGTGMEAYGDTSQAVTSFSEAVRLNPWQNTYRISLGGNLAIKGKSGGDAQSLEQAIQVFEEGVAFDPLDEDIWANLGDAQKAYATNFNQVQMFAEAEESLKRAIEIDPWFSAPNRGLGEIRLRQGRNDEALRYFEAASRINPTDADTIFFMGVAYDALGEKPAAIAAMKRVLKMNPNHQQASDALDKLVPAAGGERKTGN